jgi:hypothetical protein
MTDEELEQQIAAITLAQEDVRDATGDNEQP